MSLLFVDLSLVGIVCFVIVAHIPSFHSAVLTVELQRKGEKKRQNTVGGLGPLVYDLRFA